MVHDLFGERYIGMRLAPWHQLGLTKQGLLSAADAFVEARMDYKFHTLPIGVTLPGGPFVQTDGHFAVYRDPTPDDNQWRNLGIVSEGYKYLQNMDLAAGIDAILDKTGWTFETAGALGQGETIFVCIKTGDHSIMGDEVQSFMLVSDGKAANRALKISIVPHRVVCRNTLISAEGAASLSITVPHNAEVDKEYTTWLNLISALEKSQEETFSELRRMSQVKIDEDTARKIFEAAFPPPTENQRVKLARSIPEMKNVSQQAIDDATGALGRATTAYEYNLRQSEKWQAGALTLYHKFNAGAEQGGQMSATSLDLLRETPYAALQAVTELCDYGGTNRESVASATLFGARAQQKAKAWDAAIRIANAELN